jgi:hypothetical protein
LFWPHPSIYFHYYLSGTKLYLCSFIQ